MKIKMNTLAKDLKKFIDPENEAFDPSFARTMVDTRPDWFTKKEKDKLARWEKHRIPIHPEIAYGKKGTGEWEGWDEFLGKDKKNVK